MTYVADTTTAFDEAIAAAPMALIDFYTEWCPPCKMLAPILDTLDKEWGDDVKVIKVDIEKVPDLGARYGIMSVPTLMLFKGGEMKDHIIGARDAAALRAWVDKYKSA